jgi:hypothetical protein
MVVNFKCTPDTYKPPVGILGKLCAVSQTANLDRALIAEVRAFAALSSRVPADTERVFFGLWKIALSVESVLTLTCYAVAQSHNVAVPTHHDAEPIRSSN